MVHPLALSALGAVSNPKFPTQINRCQQFARLCLEHVYGLKYDKYRGATAALAARKWNKTAFSLLPNTPLKVGDILYWGATLRNPFGHVAIVISETHVAHNSTLCKGQKHQYKGVTAIKDLRMWQVIVRLPFTP